MAEMPHTSSRVNRPYIFYYVSRSIYFLLPYRVWFRRPTTKIQVLKDRQKAVAFFQSPKNIESTVSIQDCLKHIKCISVSA